MYNLATASVRVRRYSPSFRETRESRTCCPHGKTGPSGRWHTAQTAPPENTQPRSSVNLLLCRWDDLLGQEPQIVVRTTGAGSSIFESRRTVPGYHVVVPVQIADGYQCKWRAASCLRGLKYLLSLVGEGIEVDNRCVYFKTWENGYRFTLCWESAHKLNHPLSILTGGYTIESPF